MGALHTVARVHDVPSGSAIAVDVAGHRIALFNVDGTYYAIGDTCPHRGGPLSEGDVTQTTVTCPWHGASFDLKNGSVLGPPAASGVPSFPVHIEGDAIKVELTE